jgi:hypothetical protein
VPRCRSCTQNHFRITPRYNGSPAATKVKNRPHWHDIGATTMKSTTSTSIPRRPLLALQISKERSHYHCNTHT